MALRSSAADSGQFSYTETPTTIPLPSHSEISSTSEEVFPPGVEVNLEPSVSYIETEITRYVDVPVVEEKILQVQKTVETERLVPKFEVEVVERKVEIPRVEFVDKIEEVEEERVVYKQVPRIEQRDKIVYIEKIVPVDDVRYVEKEQFVDSGEVEEREVREVIDVPHRHIVYRDQPVEIITQQWLEPLIHVDDSHVVEVEVRRFNPVCVPVDVRVERPANIPVKLLVSKKQPIVSKRFLPVQGVLPQHMEAAKQNPSIIPPEPKMSQVSSSKAKSSMSAAEYNSWLLLLNPHIEDKSNGLPYMPDRHGSFPFLPKNSVMRGRIETAG